MVRTSRAADHRDIPNRPLASHELWPLPLLSYHPYYILSFIFYNDIVANVILSSLSSTSAAHFPSTVVRVSRR